MLMQPLQGGDESQALELRIASHVSAAFDEFLIQQRVADRIRKIDVGAAVQRKIIDYCLEQFHIDGQFPARHDGVRAKNTIAIANVGRFDAQRWNPARCESTLGKVSRDISLSKADDPTRVLCHVEK